jgi:DNA-binding transcriptional ArsR family regulator
MAEEEPKTPAPEQPAIYTMTSLEQVKVVADPLRVRILEAFCAEPRTTKQVAGLLGEKPTRLYHHVEALAKTGLIRLSDTRQVRGTVEKYYQAVAKAFRADPKLFQRGSAGDDEREALTEVITTVLENTAEEVRKLVRSGHDVASGRDGILSHLEVRASEAEVRELHDKLMALLKELEEKCCRGELSEGDRRYRLNIAYFPLDGLSKPPPSG